VQLNLHLAGLETVSLLGGRLDAGGQQLLAHAGRAKGDRQGVRAVLRHQFGFALFPLSGVRNDNDFHALDAAVTLGPPGHGLGRVLHVRRRCRAALGKHKRGTEEHRAWRLYQVRVIRTAVTILEAVGVLRLQWA